MLRWFLMFTLFTNYAFAQASLGEALSSRQKTFTEKMPKDVVDLYEKNIKDMKMAGIEKKALKVGDKVPDAPIKIGGEDHTLSEIYNYGPLVLKFYRGGWCSYCMTELKHYEKVNEEFKQAGAQIVAVSPDTDEVSKKTRAKNHISFDLVGDPKQELGKAFGLVYQLDSKVAENLKKNGIDLAAYQGNNDKNLFIPATYVISKEGKIVFSYVDADYRKRADPELVIKAIKELKKVKAK